MIGLIGYGRFGRLTVQNLSKDFKVVVYTRSTQKQQDIATVGGQLVDLDEACTQKIIILCVPISAMQETLQRIAPRLQPGTLVVDVCSVKTYPVQWMQQLLPDNIHILATHPMFGPDSAADSLTGHKIVLCPERITTDCYQSVKQWLKQKELKIIEATPAEHDRQIASSLALTHFIGRSLAQVEAAPLDIDTEGYKRLLHILEVVQNDTWQLFEDMHRYNPYAEEKRREFIRAMTELNENLAKNNLPLP